MLTKRGRLGRPHCVTQKKNMKKQTKIFLSLVIAALAFASTNDIRLQTSAQAETPKWITKVTDSVTGIFSDRELNAIKKIQSLRTQFPDIISEDTSRKVEDALIQGDEETKSTLALRIARDFKKPTKEGAKSFVNWFENWEKEGNINLAKFTKTTPDIPNAEDYQTKADNGNHYAQTVLLWIYRTQGQYQKAAEMEKALNNAPETASELKTKYKEDLSLCKSKAKDTGNAFWQSVFAEMSQRGLGQSQDISDAVSWYRKAALQGYLPAAMEMARAVNTISSKDSQKFEALLWLKKMSIVNDDNIAEMAAGLMYMNGNGVTRDHAMTVVSLKDAAAAGIPEAMYALGYIYEKGGVGVSKDAALAGAWYAVAKAHGYKVDTKLEAKSATVAELEKTITGKPSADDLALASAVFKDIFEK